MSAVYGLVYGATSGGSFPIPYDVRLGVDNGDGELGTLTSPVPANVRAGVTYGGDGTQYTGTLTAPPTPSGNAFIDAFNDLLNMQAECLGSRPTASIGGITADILIEFPNTGQTVVADAFTEDGTTWIQCLVSPFATRPIVFQAPVILNGRTLQVYNVPESNHGIYRFQIADPTRR